MVFAVTRERADAAGIASARVAEAREARRRRNVLGVEVDEVLRAGDAVGIMARRAGRF